MRVFVVAPHTGNENWNSPGVYKDDCLSVAPHTGNENWNNNLPPESGVRRCRSPYGERELKIQGLMMLKEQIMSLPMRGAWIETLEIKRQVKIALSLPIRGAWIEIPVCASVSYTCKNHSPRRERELKHGCTGLGEVWVSSLPMRGAWVENTLDKYEIKAYQDRSPYGERELKSDNVNNTACGIWSLLTRGAWIENWATGQIGLLMLSLPIRGAWIENVTKQNNPASYTRRSPRRSENWNNEENNEETSEHYHSPSRERELKFIRIKPFSNDCLSLPKQGARIEIANKPCTTLGMQHRSPRRKRELECLWKIIGASRFQVAPHIGSKNWNTN